MRRFEPGSALRPLLGALLLLAASGGSARSTVPPAVERAIEEISAAELRSHVEVLASDEFAGRGVGHPGNRKAEEYVAHALQRVGVAPAGETHYQRVELYYAALGSGARLTIRERSQPPLLDLTAGHSFYPLPASDNVAATGPLVFAGHGVSEPKLRHDDYARLNVRGAIVLVLDGAPEVLTRRAPANDGAEDVATLDRKIAHARARGASGLIVIKSYLEDVRGVWPPPASPRSTAYRLRERTATPLAVAAVAEADAVPIRRALDARRHLIVTLRPDVVAHPVIVHNVIGRIDGAGARRSETVVVGAHLDHDGVDDDGRVYNGADDNASGTAAVLAMASAFVRAAAGGERPERSVVFALWNAEEKGSLGAEAWLATPAARQSVANINLDMIGRDEEVPDPDDARFRGFRRTSAEESGNVVHVLGYSYSPDFTRMADRANERIGLTIRKEYDREAQGLLQRSDNWPFLKRRIPALFFTTGLHPDYHTPDDDTERIDFVKLERITELVSRLAWMVAGGDAPRFKLK